MEFVVLFGILALSSSDIVAAAGCPLAFAMIWAAVMVVLLLAAHGLTAI